VARVIAFISGIAAGLGLLLFVLSGITLTTPVAARAPLAPALAIQHHEASVFAHPSDAQFPPSLTGDDEESDEGAQLDLQGDEVTAAVAKYRFDAQGNIYETHAPHTEVPHLGRPTL
jgi:hypothetical protein